MTSDQVIARRYARAFYTVLGDTFPPDFLDHLARLHTFFRTHKPFVSYLKVHEIPVATKKRILIDELFSKVSSVAVWQPLVDLLATGNRLYLLENICAVLIELYGQRVGRVWGRLEVYPEISESDARDLKQFFKRKTGYMLEGEFKPNESLIAGVRMRGAFYSWDCSVRKKLEAVRRLK